MTLGLGLRMISRMATAMQSWALGAKYSAVVTQEATEATAAVAGDGSTAERMLEHVGSIAM